MIFNHSNSKLNQANKGIDFLFTDIYQTFMANHKSALKRARQNISRNKTNKVIISQIKTKIKEFNAFISKKDAESVRKSFREVNSSLSKALKRRLISKNYVSRKLSLLSNELKKIS